MSKRCTLCGGKLVDNVCVECGLDNSKNDENYSPGKSSCEGKPMTHVHTGKENTYTVQKVRKKKSTGSKALGVISILIIIMLVFSSAVPYIIDRVKEESYSEQVSEEMEMEAYDPYELVERELSGDGEEYETTLAAGLYKGGVHLPEGRYSILIESGNGTFSVSDTENNIFLSILFNDGDMEGAVTDADDVRIYRGAVVRVNGNVVLHCKSENAQMDLVQNQNPNTESKTFDSTFVAGRDIPAGVYDVYCDEGTGIFEYYIPMGGYDAYEGRLMGKDSAGFSTELKNIVLPNGVEVKMEDLKVTLTPSAYIESEDYDNFYN